MDVKFVRDSRQGAEWVAAGRYAIGMFGMSTQAKALEDQGFPIQAYLPHPMAEGQVLSASAANIYAIKNPPNPNARTLFINSKRSPGQSLQIGGRSIRRSQIPFKLGDNESIGTRGYKRKPVAPRRKIIAVAITVCGCTT